MLCIWLSALQICLRIATKYKYCLLLVLLFWCEDRTDTGKDLALGELGEETPTRWALLIGWNRSSLSTMSVARLTENCDDRWWLLLKYWFLINGYNRICQDWQADFYTETIRFYLGPQKKHSQKHNGLITHWELKINNKQQLSAVINMNEWVPRKLQRYIANITLRDGW